MNPFPYTLCFPLCAEQCDLTRQFVQVGSEGEELIGQLLGILAELGVIGVFWIIFTAPSCRLGLEGV